MTRRLPVLAAMAALASLALAPPARSDWPTFGLGVCTDPSDQTSPALAPDGAAGAFIAWIDRRTPDSGIYVQRVTSGGGIAPGWPANGLFLSQPISGIAAPSIAPDGSGGAFVAWGGDTYVLLQRVTPSGAIVAGWPAGGLVLASTWPFLEFALVVPDGSGGAIVAWSNDASANIRVQHVTGDGTLAPGWASGGITVSATGGAFTRPALASDGAGGAIVAWANFSVGSGDIYAQRVAADGTRAMGWPADGLVVCGAAGRQMATTIAADGGGGAYVGWWDERNLALTGIDTYLQRFTSAGAVAGGWPADGLAVCTAAGDQLVPRLAADETGSAIIWWPDRRTNLNGDLYAQRLTGAGAVAPGWPTNGVAVCDDRAEQSPSLDGPIPDGAGGALFLWTDSRDVAVTEKDLYVQHLAVDGTVTPGWPASGLALCAAGGDQVSSRAVSNGAGGAIVCWQDGRGGAGINDIYAGRINGDGSTPVPLSLVSAEVGENVVRIDWYVADSPGLRASLYRRTSETDWIPRGGVAADGAGYLLVEDREVFPGGRYGYRLGVLEEGGEMFAGEVWVVVPSAASFSLTAAWDRAERALRVSFSLPAEGPATLELFDSMGRRLAARRLEGLRPGSHTVVLGWETAARAGVCFLRLRQGYREARTKASQLR